MCNRMRGRGRAEGDGGEDGGDDGIEDDMILKELGGEKNKYPNARFPQFAFVIVLRRSIEMPREEKLSCLLHAYKLRSTELKLGTGKEVWIKWKHLERNRASRSPFHIFVARLRGGGRPQGRSTSRFLCLQNYALGRAAAYM